MELQTVKDIEGVVAFKAESVSEVIIGLKAQNAKQYINKMRNDPEYSHGVICPTQRTTIVLLQPFLEFMRKMDDNKFK